MPFQVESVGTTKKSPEVILKGKGGVSTKIELISFDNKTFDGIAIAPHRHSNP
jgi:hypothetical protein